MVLDNEAQKTLLLEMINALNFRGDSLERLYVLLQAVKTATISENGNKTTPAK